MNFRRNPAHSAASDTRSMTDDALAAGGHAIDSTREFAAQALERAAEKMRDLRYSMGGTATAAQRQVGRYANVTSRYVSEQPVRSAVIAAAVGAAVMAAILVARRRSSRNYY